MNLSFVDIETTGSHMNHDRIIEIGILRVEDGEVIKTYNKLINPETYLSPYITQITGIYPEDVEYAPTFEDVKDEILEILDDTIFVAHNVRFDYGFIKNELKRYGHDFNPQQICTVKLSRLLFPEHRKHSLDALIERFGFTCENRHRAFDDASILFDFYKLIHNVFPKEKINEAIKTITKRPALPSTIPQQMVDKLPDSPGVYIFYGENNVPLYVGKSINIRTRILSHFSNDHSSTKEMSIKKQLTDIETIQTAGELGALIKEAAIVKKLQPIYNRQLRRIRRLTIIEKILQPQNYHTIGIKEVDSITEDMIEKILGIFPSGMKAKNYLKQLAKDHCLCQKLLGLEKAKGACFGSKIEQCLGACRGDEHVLKYNLRFDEAFYNKKIKNWPFRGPILITEKDPIENRTESFIVNNWCLISPDEDNLEMILHADTEVLHHNLQFDYDIYKILVRYIFDKRNQKNISVLDSNNSSQFNYFFS